VEDSESDGSFPDSAGTDEGDGSEVFCEINDLLDQLVPSKEDPRWWWRGFSGYTLDANIRFRHQLVVEIADLARV
jgi:hypothetical protein